jgi:hypothetical protein
MTDRSLLTRGEENVVKFYRQLDRYNISKKTFEQELTENWNERRWINNDLCSTSEQTNKRSISQYMEDARPRDSATREHGRGTVRRHHERHGWLAIPSPWTEDSMDDMTLDGVTAAEQLAVLTCLMGQLTLEE